LTEPSGRAAHDDDVFDKAYDSRLMRRLLGYVAPYRRRVALAVVVLLLGAAIELVGPLLTMHALDRAIPAGDMGLLATLAALYVGTLLVGYALEFAQTILTTWLGQQITFDLRQQIFDQLQRLDLAYFDRNPVGRLMTRITSDTEALNELFSSGVVTLFGDVFTLLLIMVAMTVLDWRLALVTFSVLPFVVLVAFLFRARIRQANRDIRERLARINAFLQERLSGVTVVQLFGREADTARRFRRIDHDHLEAHLRSITYYALFFPAIEILTAVAFALILTYGGAQILGGTLTVGVLAAYFQYSRRFFRPIQDLSEKYNTLQAAMAASERVFTLLDTAPRIAAPPDPRPLPEPGRGEIEFRGVWFAYGRTGSTGSTGEPEWDWVLRDVSFRVAAGERVAVVGHTGAGKTTLINLLMRFHDPQRGEILFDGVPIAAVDPLALRRRIGLVLQDVFLFSRDMAHNIRLGRGDLDDGAVRRAAARVGADVVADRLPRGFAEPLGERGASLSVGERQLLSFARALAFDPLVLVLDEATSSVDSELEARLEDAARTLLTGRTALVIAHRLSTIQDADRILVFHHGELREEGTHGALLAADGLYARLHALQFAAPAAAGDD
jgi:ATP-binding cassette, subfamily B, multidrug efflux pump